MVGRSRDSALNYSVQSKCHVMGPRLAIICSSCVLKFTDAEMLSETMTPTRCFSEPIILRWSRNCDMSKGITTKVTIE